MGFDAFFFTRIDYDDIAHRRKAKEMEFVWRTSQSRGAKVDLFTSVMYDGYGPPDGFCFECWNVSPVQDDMRLYDPNIQVCVA